MKTKNFFIIFLAIGFITISLQVNGQSILPFSFPDKPKEKPLNWPAMADAFDAFVMDTANKAMYIRSDGRYYFPSDLRGHSDELTTYGPVVLGKILRGDDVSKFLP